MVILRRTSKHPVPWRARQGPAPGQPGEIPGHRLPRALREAVNRAAAHCSAAANQRFLQNLFRNSKSSRPIMKPPQSRALLPGRNYLRSSRMMNKNCISKAELNHYFERLRVRGIYCIRSWVKHYACHIPFESPKDCMSSWFFRRRNSHTGKLSHLSRVTELVSGTAGIWTRAVWEPSRAIPTAQGWGQF